MQERQGSRAMKNLNNLVKDVLIRWSLQQVTSAGVATVEVLDVCSGRGGDQMKFLQAPISTVRLCYNAVDIAEAQILEAQKRLRQRLPLEWLESCRFFIGDVTLLAPTLPDEPLPWQHIVSIQFALHYAFKSKASARSFLHNATGRLCGGGLLIITTVDSSKIGEFARQAAEKQEFVFKNELAKISFDEVSLPRCDLDSKVWLGLSIRPHR
ncbi:unnamed protein product [Durusdinium trenchii]|uniref:mRNA (guanine-N(7))-methyltransferase n=1 Tax=Durusdinium trenchii TaxID=1381693 RepID=A0ABP0JNV1_9DINO